MYMTALLPATDDPFRRRRHASVPAGCPPPGRPGGRSRCPRRSSGAQRRQGSECGPRHPRCGPAERRVRIRHAVCGHVPWPVVLVLLPPSETKAPGGDGAPLDLAALSWPELTGVRTGLVDTLVELAGDRAAARSALGLSERQDDEIARNAALRATPTAPALERYTGVLYDALDVRSLTRAQRARADRRLAVGAALFGVVRGTARIPAHRLSVGSALPGRPALGRKRGGSGKGVESGGRRMII